MGVTERPGEMVLSGNTQLNLSKNSYDWLGKGVYFWESNLERALSYGTFLRDHDTRAKKAINNPFIVGAVIDLGFCLNLADENALILAQQQAHSDLASISADVQTAMPINEPGFKGDQDLLKRHLDCAVFETLHGLREEGQLDPFDSVRGPFWEGDELCPSTLFRQKAHIQLCVRNPRRIKGYFRPLGEDGRPLQP